MVEVTDPVTGKKSTVTRQQDADLEAEAVRNARGGGMAPKKRGAPPMDFMGPGDTPGLSNGFTSPPQLGTTGQPRGQAPKVPIGPGQARGGAAGGGAAAAPRMRIIEDTKTGETESEMMTDEEAQAFMQGNPGVQVR